MNEYLADFLSALIKVALINGAVFLVLKLSGKEKPTDISLIMIPRIFLIVGIVCTLIALGGTLGAFFFSESRSDALFGLPFVLLGLFLIACCVNWVIRIDGDIAIYRNMFRRTCVFRAEEVESLRITNNVIRLKVKGKTFWIDPYALNLRSLGDFLRKNPNLRKAVHQAKW